MYLPIKTIKTAGTSIPINGTKRDGNQLATISEDIHLRYIFITLVQIISYVVIILLDDIKIY